METLEGLKEGSLVAHRSKAEVTMVVYSIHKSIGVERETAIHCRWLSSLNEPQERQYRLYELVKIS